VVSTRRERLRSVKQVLTMIMNGLSDEEIGKRRADLSLTEIRGLRAALNRDDGGYKAAAD
jgi:hypothetical protein